MNKINPNVDFYFNKASKWQKEMEQLRVIALQSGLTEELKWGCPCYTFQKSNVIIIHGFKEYCAFLFIKGALLKDSKHILIQQTENVQAGRQIRFTNVNEIIKLENTLKAYIKEAIEVEKSGVKVTLNKNTNLIFPVEFKNKLEEKPSLKLAFQALTPGRQRAYNLFFSAPKQSKTREARVEKCIPQILIGKGLDD